MSPGPPNGGEPEWLRALREIGTTASAQIARFQRALADSDLNAQLRRTVKTLVEDVGPVVTRAMEEWKTAFDEAIPPNWQRLTHPQIFAAIDLMKQTGWSVVWTPRAEVIGALLEQDDLEGQKDILLGAEGQILDDLSRLLREVEHPRLCELASAAEEALECHRSGQYRAAQALTAVVLSTGIHEIYGHDRFDRARAAFEKLVPDDAGIRELRLAALSAAVLKSIDRWRPGDPDPPTFNRHASTHRLKPAQYSPVNSLTSLMLLISFLRETQTVLRLIEEAEETAPEADAK